PEAAPSEDQLPWRLAAEAGGFLARRRLEYGGIGPMSGTLRGFDAPSIAGPWLGAELRPLARARSAALGGIGLYGSWQTSIGFTTTAPTGELRATRYTAYQVGATWRTPALGAPRLVLAPSIAWKGRSLTVSPSIPGLADARLSGVTAGMGAEARLGRVVILGRGGYVRWIEAKELVGGTPAFFPGGSARAIEAEAGIGVGLWGALSLRAIGEYGLTRYSLDPDPTGTYAAARAEDRILGARVVARLEL
ncbi:MAG: hypothetical protein WCC48_18325, partial [Anaeromyxobacteraceae bacterium]